MNFREGLNYVYKNHGSEVELTDPFVLHSKLSDLCGSSYQDKQKIELFYKINKRLNVIKSVLSADEDVFSKYSEVEELLSKESFLGLINTVKKVLDSNYVEKEKPKPTPQKTAVKKVVTQQAQNPPKESRTIINNSNKNYSALGLDLPAFLLKVLLYWTILATVVLSILAFACDWYWGIWQWILGIVGGVTLFTALSFAVWWFEDETICDYYILGTVLLGVFVVINFVLVLVFQGDYKIIFGCISVLELICGAILAYFTEAEFEDECLGVQVIEMVVALALFIIAMVWIW